MEQQETTDLPLSALAHLKERIPEGAVLSQPLMGGSEGWCPIRTDSCLILAAEPGTRFATEKK